MNSRKPLSLDTAAKAARRAYKNSLPKAVRKAAKASGWRCSQGYIFREMDGWFIFATLKANLLRCETRMRLAVKPMQMDPVFWQIVSLEENISQPLSFRLFGAWTCQPPTLFDVEIAESKDLTRVDDLAARFLSLADGYLPTIRRFTLEELLRLCRDRPRPENFLAVEVITLIILGRNDEVRALCEQAIEAGHVGGFMHGRRLFPNMVMDWLNSSI